MVSFYELVHISHDRLHRDPAPLRSSGFAQFKIYCRWKSFMNLALVYYEQEKFREALEHMQKAYTVHSQNLPSDHRNMRRILGMIDALKAKLKRHLTT
jgi:hypothetical protein